MWQLEPCSGLCLHLLLAWILLSWLRVGALEFDMVFQTKCVMEEISNNVLVVGEYRAFQKTDPSKNIAVTVQVEGPNRELIYDKKDTNGQWTFTTKTTGEYKVCFTAPDVNTAKNTKLKVDWRMGVEAMNWDTVAKKDNLDALTVELKKLEETAKHVHNQVLTMKKREQEMRDLNEATNDRVAYFSVGLLVICISLAVWQLWYLKNFFMRKKIL